MKQIIRTPGMTVLMLAILGATALVLVEVLSSSKRRAPSPQVELTRSESGARAESTTRSISTLRTSSTTPVQAREVSTPNSTGENVTKKLLAISPEKLWSTPATEPTFSRFQDWVQRYNNSTNESERSTLEAEGVQIATERRGELRRMISSDPEHALELSVPFIVARDLPASVQQHLEERVSGRGSLDILGAVPQPGRTEGFTPTYRHVSIGERSYEAFVYGRRAGHGTRANIRLNGIAVDDRIALNESPVRLLDAAETTLRVPAQAEAICSVSGNPATATATPVAADAGGETFVLCGPSHVLKLAANLASAEDAAATGGADGPGLAASAATEGTKRLILIRVDFSDLQGAPFTDTAGANLVSGMNDFYSEMSYGRTGFHLNGNGSSVTATLRMPQTVAYYVGLGYPAGVFALRSAARSAATTAGHNLNLHDYDIICFNDIPEWGWAGLGYVGAPGSWLNGYFSVGVAGHEVGHNFGLNHASFWDTGGHSVLGNQTAGSIEYGDNQDTMGSANAGSYHFNARNKSLLNWIRSGEVITASSSGTYRIYPHDDASVTNSFKVIKIARGASSNYWVEFRQKFTSNKWLMSGAGIRMAPNGSSYSQLLDMTPGSPDGKNDAALVIGRTFSDTTAGVHITTLRKGGTTPESLDIVVNLGTFAGNNTPSIAIDAPSTTASTGATLTFTASASDADGDPLAYYWDFGDGTFGTNGTTASKSWSSAGEYVVRCVVSDMKGREASDSVLVTVGSPSSYRISGTITSSGNPAAGIRVSAGPLKMATTDSDGTYTITGLSAGTYYVTASHQSYDSFTESGFSNPVSVGPSRTGIDFTGEASSGGGGTVTLTSPSGSPTYTAPATVSMAATATASPFQAISKVEFFQGTTKLGEDSMPPYTYSWTGVTAGSYTLTARSSDTGGYAVTSAPVNITVNPLAPTITSQPQSRSVIAGTNVTFSVTASGSAPFTYRWRLNGTNLAGAVSSSLSLNNVQPSQAGGYSVVVSNAAGTATSSTANLVVTCTYTLSASSAAFSSDGGSGSLNVTTAGSCDWDVLEVPAWVTINSGSSGTGNGTVGYTVAANTNSSNRSATLEIGGRNYVISQGAPDLTRPTVAFSTPSSSTTITSSVVTVTGTANDNDNLARVDIAVGANDFATATGTEDWSASVSLQPGTNIVRVRSVDLSGNLSLTNTRSLFCVVPSSLNLVVNGAGAISGATNGQRFPIGKACKLTAVPLAGYVFSNWSGHVSGDAPNLTFVMQSNLQVVANFVTNPFSANKGAFNGLFHQNDQVRLGQSGFFNFVLADKGTYSAYVQIGTRKTKASGRLSLEGRATNIVSRPGTNSLTITWAVALDGSDQITGTVSDGTWTADLLGDRATYNSKLNPSPITGYHTLLLLGTPGGALAPEGDSFGSVSVDLAGSVKFKASLADKTSAAGKVPLSKNGQWPLYVPLHGGKGALLGWVNFTNQASTDFEGLISWIKPALPGTALYPDGFSSESALLGSRYRPPSGNTNRLLELSNAVVIVTGGNLATSYTNDVQVGASGKITNTGPDRVVMTFSAGTGLFSGSFTPQGASKAASIRGAALQKANFASGFFLGTNQSGRVSLEVPPLSPSAP